MTNILKGSEDVGIFVCSMVRKPTENDFDSVKKFVNLEKKTLLSTEAMIFYKEDLIYNNSEFSGDLFKPYIEVLSKIFWKSFNR